MLTHISEYAPIDTPEKRQWYERYCETSYFHLLYYIKEWNNTEFKTIRFHKRVILIAKEQNS